MNSSETESFRDYIPKRRKHRAADENTKTKSIQIILRLSFGDQLVEKN